MPAPTTADELLDLIQKSGVADAATLKAAVANLLSAEELPATADRLAELFVRDAVLTHFQAEQLLLGKWKRFTVGKYKVLERLGSGGMGQVFLCEHKVMRRRVAVKVLPAAKAADPAALERFHREARAVAALDHPNLVRAFDVDQEDHIHYIVLEYVDGTNLQDLVANRVRRTGSALSVAEACHYIHDAALGLQHARDMGLVHRDIKPANILVDRSGQVKVLDLGLARFFHDQSDQLTQKFDETTLGTADYIAPEQVNDSHAADIRADLYALGGTLYFLLTGRPPFHEGTVPQKLVWHQTRDPIPVTTFRSDVPPGVLVILKKLLAKNPADRYQTPSDLLAALGEWVRGPIPLPSVEELPRLSPALARQSSGRMAKVMGLQSFSDGPTGISAAMPTIAAPADPAAVWTAVAAETRAADGDTGPTTSPGSTPPRTVQPNRVMRTYTRYVVAGGIVLAVASALTIWAVGSGNSKPLPPAETTPVGPNRLYVSRGANSPDPTHTFASLSDALVLAKPKDTVVLLDPTWEEGPLRLSGRGKNGIRDVSIISETPAGETVWHVSKSKAGGDAALELFETPNVSIRGLTIQTDGRYPVGLSVVGSCPGLRIDRLTVCQATQTGIRFTNAAGDPDAPIALSRFRVVTADRADSGVTFQANHPLANRDIQLLWGRIEGPGAQAVAVNGPLIDVGIANTRFFDWDAGVALGAGLFPDSPLQLVLASNTFYGMKSGGILVDGDIPLSVKSKLAMRRNYFAKMPVVVAFVRSKRFNLPGLELTDNGRDKGTREGKISFRSFEVPVTGIANADPDSDQFLRYTWESGLAAAGPNKVPVGVPPD
ncbi:MAG TPA: serine/threonine-protein kinase [Fimbriiglobus sp.]|jgi:serine/threonine protein kinase